MIRATAGAALGVAGWAVLAVTLPFLPDAVRFALAWLLFTFGPGVAVGAWLTRDLDPLRRTIVLLGFGSAAVPVVVDLVGRAHLLSVFPYVATALFGVGLAQWNPAGVRSNGRTSRADVLACLIIVGLALGTGAIAFSHRLQSSNSGITVYGDYDSMDLSYYAVMASEASHTVPPTAAYYSGHALNAAYYPQLVLAMIHRFASVPLLAIYFRYAWPAFLALGALTAYLLVRSLASTGVALLAVVLLLVGGDFSYLAAWLLPHDTIQWDYLLWPTNFLSPTMEVLHFNTWAPSLPLFFMSLFALARGFETRRYAWIAAGALLIAVLFQFKPFAFLVLLPALFAAGVVSPGDASTRRRFLAALALSIVFAFPFVYGAATQPDRRSRFLIDFFLLPQRMLLKLDLIEAFTRISTRLAPVASLARSIYLLLAMVVFLAVGLGIRWLGVPRVWHAVRDDGGPNAAPWRLLGWVVVVGVGMPFVLVTDPYVDTLQFYQTGLYVLWVFTAVALVAFVGAHPRAGGVALVMAVAMSLPSSLHFLTMKWTERQRPPRVSISAGDVTVAEQLRTSDPQRTVLLHDKPMDPSLLAIMSNRRVALGWGHPYYAVGSAERLREVNAFFGSAGGDPRLALETLRRYQVTHVVVHEDRDRVHPDVLAALRLLTRTPDGVALYGVPSS